MGNASSETAVTTASVANPAPSIEVLQSQNAALIEQNRYLREQLDLLKRHIFGHKSEKLPPSLMSDSPDLFGLDPVQAKPSVIHVPAHQREVVQAGHGRVALPDNLPCEDIVLDVPESEKTCPCCGKPREHIGNDLREELDIVPPQFHKRRYIRPKYACRQCTECGVAQAKPAVAVIDKGIPSVGLLVWIVLSKYLDHLPLHRIASQFKRWGVDVPEATMVGWLAAIFDLLGPIHRAMEHEIRQCGCIHADETTLRVQRGEKDKRGLGKSSVDYLWAMLGRGPDGTPVGVSFLYADGRQHAVAKSLLEGVESGYLITDGYPAYDALCLQHCGIVHAACWAHARRKFHEALQCGNTMASHPLDDIRRIYQAQHRIDALVDALGKRWKRFGRKLSQERIDQIVLDRRGKWMKPWVEHIKAANLKARHSVLPKGKLGEAIGYLHNQFPKLEQVLRHARLSLDNNVIERAIRAVAVGRKNWLFAGSEEGAKRAALLISLVGTCRMLDIDPALYLKDVLIQAKTQSASPKPVYEGLTPSQWKKGQAT